VGDLLLNRRGKSFKDYRQRKDDTTAEAEKEDASYQEKRHLQEPTGMYAALTKGSSSDIGEGGKRGQHLPDKGGGSVI